MRSVTVRDSSFDFLEGCEPLVPAMAENVPALSGRGIIALNIDELRVENVTMNHITGEMVQKL